MSTTALLLAIACVAVMGFAIQRGATCTVAAVDEWVAKRTASRLLGMGEAALWVAGGLVVARAVQALPVLPSGYAAGLWTIAGGVLLGLGAWVNGACVFGAIARLGSGEWAYVLTPLGYYIGCLAVPAIFAPPAPERLAEPSPLFAAPAWLAVVFVLLALVRLMPPLLRRLSSAPSLAEFASLRSLASARSWKPHAATIVIGITFLFTWVLVGNAWAYTDLLAELARGQPFGPMKDGITRVALFAALLAGAVWGGYSAGRLKARRPGAAQVARCLAGGALMGAGTLLIPGSNDGLILVGMPLLLPYAWLAFGTMCVTIAAALALARWRRRESSHFDHGKARDHGAA
jgi:toxin CptA